LGLVVTFANACGDKKNEDPPFDPSKCIDLTATPATVGLLDQRDSVVGLGGQTVTAPDGAQIAANEINNGCGLLGTKEIGISLNIFESDYHGDAALLKTSTDAAIAAGASAVVYGANGVPDLPYFVQNSLPAMTYNTISDFTAGCTDAEYANASVTKVATVTVGDPTKCFDSKKLLPKVTSLASEAALAAVPQLGTLKPALTSTAFIYSPPLAASQPLFKAAWLATGKTYAGDYKTTGITPTQDELQTALKNLAEAGNPQIIVTQLNPGPTKSFFEAYVTLRDDATWAAKPSNFDALVIFNTLSLGGTDFSTLSAKAFAVASDTTRTYNIGHGIDRDHPGFAPYETAFRDYRGDPSIEVEVQGACVYEAVIIEALAMLKAGTSTDGVAIAQAIEEVRNAPGEKIYAGDFKKARDLIWAGQDIDFDGTGSCGIDQSPRGFATEMVYVFSRIEADGLHENDDTAFHFTE